MRAMETLMQVMDRPQMPIASHEFLPAYVDCSIVMSCGWGNMVGKSMAQSATVRIWRDGVLGSGGGKGYEEG